MKLHRKYIRRIALILCKYFLHKLFRSEKCGVFFSPSEGRGLGVRGVTSRGESADKSKRGAVVPFGSLADVACHAYKR